MLMDASFLASAMGKGSVACVRAPVALSLPRRRRVALALSTVFRADLLRAFLERLSRRPTNTRATEADSPSMHRPRAARGHARGLSIRNFEPRRQDFAQMV